MSFMKEFRDFAMRGNVIDLAVGVVIGGAFSGIVKSLVDDVIMPPIGYVLGGVDFSNLFVTIKEGTAAAAPYASLAAAKAAGAVTINIGLFINALISFIIVAFAIFMLIKAINKLTHAQKKEAESTPAPETKECPRCLATDIPVKATRCSHCTSDL
ncbi:MAG: large conductance mechanosensitive channel protein MscL [Neisseriaceae bacterium]|nr:large conductance mechanosensitive channel protein MscL [Neisseriaceae bacterium]